MESARREVETADGVFQKGRCGRRGLAVRIDLPASEAGVGFSLSCELARPGLAHALPDERRRFAVRGLLQHFRRHRRDLDLQIDAVEQRAGDPVAITRHLLSGAPAAAARIPVIATGAWPRCLFAIGPRKPQGIETTAF
jgi:hypothetical protein